MENIIVEHFDSREDYQTFSLIFDVEPYFFKTDEGIKFYDTSVFLSYDVEKQGIFYNSMEEGIWISWYENGRKLQEGKYHNGEKEDIWISWYGDGQKREEGNYRNGKQVGLWKQSFTAKPDCLVFKWSKTSRRIFP